MSSSLVSCLSLLGVFRRNGLYDVDVEDLDVLLWLLLIRPRVLDLMDNVEPLGCSPENGVLPVQPRLFVTVRTALYLSHRVGLYSPSFPL